MDFSRVKGQLTSQDWVIRALVVLATLFALSPFFQTLRPPMQDLPQHLAAGRVLLEGNNPSLAFESYFTTEWLRSQYLGIYALMGVFFHPLRWFVDQPLLWSNRLALVVLGATWVGGSEWLGQRLLKRVGIGGFALALFFNVHLILGFLNFLLGIAFLFLGLALFSSLRSPSPRPNIKDWRLWLLAFVCLACFYFHIVPFALLVSLIIGSAGADAALGTWRSRRAPTQAGTRAAWSTYAALGPALLATLSWLTTPAGVSTREAASGGGSRGKAQFLSLEANHDALPSWMLDSFRSEGDTEWLTVVLLGLGVFALVEWGLRLTGARLTSDDTARPANADTPTCDTTLLWLTRLVAPACFVAYYVLPAGYDWIWPINARFPVIGLMFLPYWLPPASIKSASGVWRHVARAASVGLSVLLLSAAVAQTSIARAAFAGFEQEMDGLDELLQELPEGKRVASLVFERGSRHIGFAPFLHVGAYTQAERGGVTFFSFNDFPQSPVRFREDNRPPRVEPRWEWKPERVRPDRDLAWFEYLIVRGGPAQLKNADTFTQVAAKGRFRLFKRSAP